MKCTCASAPYPSACAGCVPDASSLFDGKVAAFLAPDELDTTAVRRTDIRAVEIAV